MKVAVYQADAAAQTPDQRLAALQRQLQQHQDSPADLLLCPELFVSGYGSASDIRSYARSSDDALMQNFCDLAAGFQTVLVIGYAERTAQGIYNAVMVISATGAVLANHRKRVLPTPYEEDLFLCGNDKTLVELENGWKIGIVICYEVEIPEAVRQCAVAGADLVLAPTALGIDWPIVSRHLIPTRAFENNVFLAYANYAGQDQGASYIGESVILAPTGEELARADDREGWIEAELQHAEIATARVRLNYLKDFKAFL